MTTNYQASPQWERISQYWMTDGAASDLTNFKSDRRNHKISLWNPDANGVRYLKTLIYNLATELGPDDWKRLRNTLHRDVGNPIAVELEGESICLDYLQAILEVAFIERQLDLHGTRVLEIGPGYGRTCHTLLSNHDIASYCIVDLSSTMQFSMRYLRTVLDDAQFAKIDFVSVDDVDDTLESRHFDLCVNIDSFHEMAPDTAQGYLDQISRRCSFFYVKNPVGKYLDKSLDGHFEGNGSVARAMKSGLLRQVLDVHSSEAVKAAVPAFISAYRPAAEWTCVADGWAVPWSFYWQAIYKDNSTETDI